ncbi:MAG: DnaD domain protein [Chloroflexi bacterium]|nr:DnaD domain protein [Chloroflexota bacterium]
MDESELRVTLVMIRETFGYHRSGFRMGINKLAAATGLSRNGTKAGAEAAENRGTFRRINPNGAGSAEWELVVHHPLVSTLSTSDEPSHSDQGGGQSMTRLWSTSDQQSGIKESNKEKEKNTTTSTTPNNFALYESNIGPLTPMISDALKDAEQTYSPDWVARAIQEAAKSNVRRWNYIEGVLRGYKDRGSPDIGRDFAKPQQSATKSYRTAMKTSPTESNEEILRRVAQNVK